MPLVRNLDIGKRLYSTEDTAEEYFAEQLMLQRNHSVRHKQSNDPVNDAVGVTPLNPLTTKMATANKQSQALFERLRRKMHAAGKGSGTGDPVAGLKNHSRQQARRRNTQKIAQVAQKQGWMSSIVGR